MDCIFVLYSKRYVIQTMVVPGPSALTETALPYLLLHPLILSILTTSLVYICFVLCRIAQFVMFEISMTSFISSFPISGSYDLGIHLTLPINILLIFTPKNY